MCSCLQVQRRPCKLCCEFFPVYAHNCLTVFFVRDYEKYSKLRLAKRLKLNIMVRICPTATWFSRANKSYGLFMLGHTDVSVSSSFVVNEKVEAQLCGSSCLRMATMIVDRANHCCASLPCLTTQCLSVSLSMDNEEAKLSLSMWFCPQTAASVVLPSKTLLCVVFLVDHTLVSVSSLFVDTR